MKLFEYQAKNILADYGIPVPNGRLALSAEEALEISQNIGQDVMIKAQILMGGRGKSGGIRLAKKSQEVEEIASEILEMSLHGFLVNKILVEELINVEREIYIAITIDREVRQPLLLASSLGGINVEDAIRRSPQSISRAYINPMFGVMDFQARDVAAGIDLPRDLWTSFTNLTQNLWLAFWNCDATLIEINPLVVSDNKQLIALDSKMNLDDNALFRHPDYAAMWHQDAVDPIEIEAHKLGLSYVRMDGNIGCLVNGLVLRWALWI